MRNWRALLRYNLTVVVSQSVWLIIVPVAATQVLVLWYMAMASLYKVYTPVQVVELLAPMLAAFLAAHALGSEYRYRAEEVLLCKPTSISSLLWQRLLVLYAFLALLIGIVLAIFHFGLQPRIYEEEVPLRLLIVAGVPSTLFLSMLALSMATLFRNPMLGWLLAGLYWGLDLVGGVRFNPLLTLQAYTAQLKFQPMGEFWHWSKIVLVALAALFYFLNGRWLRSPEGLRRREQRRRAYTALALAFAFYLYSGAWVKIQYGLRKEQMWGRLARLQYQELFQVYRGLPVARAFGPDFAAYIYRPSLQPGEQEEANEPAGEGGRAHSVRQAEMASLARVVEHYPRSRWADNALFALAQAYLGQNDLEGALEGYALLAKNYPDSVFASFAMQANAQILGDTLGRQEEALQLWEQLLQRYPSSWEVWSAATHYARGALARGQGQAAAELLARVAPAAPETLGGMVQIARAELLWAMGDREAARQASEAALPALRQADQLTTPVQNRNLDRRLERIHADVRAALKIADALKNQQPPSSSFIGLVEVESPPSPERSGGPGPWDRRRPWSEEQNGFAEPRPGLPGGQTQPRRPDIPRRRQGP